jgi:chemotaxis protein MotB
VSTTGPTSGGTSYRRAKRLRGEADATHQEMSQERWLLTYSDMITLLLVLFIVLFALSSINQAKFREFRQSAAHAFLTHTPQGTTTAHTNSEAKAAPVNQLQQIEQALSSVLSANRLLGDVTLTITSAGLVEGLVSDSTFFATNSADLSPMGAQIVDLSSGVLKGYQNAIEVAGYADDAPIAGGPFANNWELSAARATTVVIRMTTIDEVDPGQVVLLGYGQYHPLAPNTTPIGQSQNRRVNIVVSPTSQFKQ